MRNVEGFSCAVQNDGPERRLGFAEFGKPEVAIPLASTNTISIAVETATLRIDTSVERHSRSCSIRHTVARKPFRSA